MSLFLAQRAWPDRASTSDLNIDPEFILNKNDPIRFLIRYSDEAANRRGSTDRETHSGAAVLRGWSTTNNR